ncbi:MAG: PDZ domain-containing protein [Acidimicrobiales bacterium]|nr:PDZ domain-containing protein [Acidimicrobiales bacterium]
MVSGDDDIGDDSVSWHGGPPPPMADRTWQHPAEYAREARRLHRRHRARRLRILALGSVVGAGLVASISLRTNPETVGESATIATVTDTTGPEAVDPLTNWANEISARARASTVVVQSPTGTAAIALAVAIGPDGFLVTSSRALGDQTSFVVHTQAGTIHTAELLGGDADTDIAVLTVDGTIRSALIAISGPVAGDPVAIIDAFNTARPDEITHDTVIATADDGEPLIGVFSLSHATTDAISGAPVVNADGAVTGITAHTSRADVIVGVPIAVAARVAADLIESGGVAHPWLGVSLADVGPAIVTAVVADGPASRAGITPNDLIQAVDGEPIDDAAALVAALLGLEPGHRVELDVDRSGEALTVWFDLGARPVDG